MSQPGSRTFVEGDATGAVRLLATWSPPGKALQFPPVSVPLPEPPRVQPLAAEGRLYTYTVIHPGRDADPYTIGFVDFPEGVRVFGRLDIPAGQRPSLGMPIAVRAAEDDYRFVPGRNAR